MAKKRTSFMKCVEDFRARVYLQLNKIFQCSVASISQSQTSSGLLLLKRDSWEANMGMEIEGDGGACISST
ncbi:unnamed protein product [Camellia sinensis]